MPGTLLHYFPMRPRPEQDAGADVPQIVHSPRHLPACRRPAAGDIPRAVANAPADLPLYWQGWRACAAPLADVG